MTTYRSAGVDPDRYSAGLSALLGWVKKTEAFHPSGPGSRALGVGYYAAVLDLGGGRGLAVSCDGVGTKLLVAQLAGKYDTVGIDCIAMNVNDLICVGAEPFAVIDYLAVEDPAPEILEAIGRGLHEGCRLAGSWIPGGELAQIPDMLRGPTKGAAFDLVATAIGFVDLARVNCGREVRPGDQLVGIASSGLHSNGYSLVRKTLLAPRSGYRLDTHVPELGRTLVEELLEPTHVYVDLVKRVRAAGVEPTAYANITGDGLLNVLRVEPAVTFVVDAHPEPPPIFGLVQKAGQVADEEMFQTFNMGVGFVLVVRPADADRTIHAAALAGHRASIIGRVEAGPREVQLPRWSLVGDEDRFTRR